MFATASRHDSLPFGEEMVTGQGLRTAAMGYSASDYVRQKFTQKERDMETGLDYFEARYYSSVLGRFTSVDPILTSARKTNPQSWNRYIYVLNTPLTVVDPNGLEGQQNESIGIVQRMQQERQNEPISTIDTGPAAEPNFHPMIATPQDQQLIQGAMADAGPLTQTQLTNANQALRDALGMVAAPSQPGVINPCRQALIANFGSEDPTAALQSTYTTGGAAHMGPNGITEGPQNVFNGMTTQDTGKINGQNGPIASFLANNPSTQAVTTPDTGRTYLSNSFNARDQLGRAQDMIHERVVHAANRKSDVQFGPANSSHRATDGSHRINDIIRANCNKLPK